MQGRDLDLRRLVFGSLLVVTAVVVIAVIICLSRPSKQTVWEEDFHPDQMGRWHQVSAAWEDVTDDGAVLRETNRQADFGKVETDVIHASPQAALCLDVRTQYIDVDSSYTVQILDKNTITAVDVLKGITAEGLAQVNITKAMSWQPGKPQVFTINIWISGEGKSVILRAVRVYEC
jgi:hypothetical protein